MSALVPIPVTASFDQWRQSCNTIIDRVNNISSADDVFTLQDPVNNQDILVYDSSTQKFTNQTIQSLVTEILTQLSSQTTTQLKPYYWASLRNIF